MTFDVHISRPDLRFLRLGPAHRSHLEPELLVNPALVGSMAQFQVKRLRRRMMSSPMPASAGAGLRSMRAIYDSKRATNEAFNI